MAPPCTLPEKLAVSGVIRTVMVSWWAGRSIAVSLAWVIDEGGAVSPLAKRGARLEFGS